MLLIYDTVIGVNSKSMMKLASYFESLIFFVSITNGFKNSLSRKIRFAGKNEILKIHVGL
jgi:hypothetical protein